MSNDDIVVGEVKMIPIKEASPKIHGTYWIATRASLRVKGSIKRGARRIMCATRMSKDLWSNGVKHSDVTDVSANRIGDKRLRCVYGFTIPK